MIRISDMVSGLNERGAYFIGACPFCGGDDRFQIKKRPDGSEVWFCRHCGEGRYHDAVDFVRRRDNCDYRTAVERLAEYQPSVTVQSVTRPRPAQAAPDFSDAASRAAAHPKRYALWSAYKPLTAETVNGRNLGVGILPRSRCRHERLIVPVYDAAGRCVNLRGRAIACDCAKWLVAGGWTLDALPLYGLDVLQPGGVLWIVENPIDALMIAERTPYTGSATLSVSYWRQEWTAAIVEREPSLVVVAYDNDLVGNGGALRRDAMLAAWREKLPASHKNQKPPIANGVKLVNLLLGAGLTAALYDWKNAEPKADIGGMIIGA